MTDDQLKTLDLLSTRIINASSALYDAQLALSRFKATPETKDSNLIAISTAKNSLKTEIMQFDDFVLTLKKSNGYLLSVTRYVDSIRNHTL